VEIGTVHDVAVAPVEDEGASRVSIAWLIDASKGAPTFAMRLFSIEPGGCTPRHAHPWEHEIFVVSGSGRVWSAGSWTPLKEGSFALVLPNEEHQFGCRGDEVMRFLCLVPNPT
jgi:quercetin dioxygenase-like cupin family protein